MDLTAEKARGLLPNNNEINITNKIEKDILKLSKQGINSIQISYINNSFSSNKKNVYLKIVSSDYPAFLFSNQTTLQIILANFKKNNFTISTDYYKIITISW